MKTKLTFILFLISNLSFAQIHKGSWMIGGSGDLRSFTSSSNLSSSGSIQPQIGYFLSDGILLGTTIGYSIENNTFRDFNNTFKSKNRAFLLIPFLRYYPSPPSNPWFLQLDLEYNTRHNVLQTTDSNNNIGKRLEANFGAGMNWFLTDNIALEGLLRYRLFDAKSGIFVNNSPLSSFFEDKQERFFPLAIQFQLGIQLFLNHLKTKKFSDNLVQHYLKKGNKIWGGQIQMNYDQADNDFSFELTPLYTHFLTDFWAVHGLARFAVVSRKRPISKQDNTNFSQNKSSSFAPLIGTSYHFKLWKNLFLVPESSIAYQHSVFNFNILFADGTGMPTLQQLELSSKSVTFQSGLSLKYFVIDRFIFSSRFGSDYTRTNTTEISSVTSEQTDSLTKILTFNWRFGMEYFLSDDLIFSINYITRISDIAMDEETLDFSIANPTNNHFSIGLNYLIGGK